MKIADSKCSVTLFSTGKSDVASFYEIWQAVTAVFSVCTQHGKGGSIRGLGMFSNNLYGPTQTGSADILA